MSRDVPVWLRRWRPAARGAGRTSPVTPERLAAVVADRGYRVRGEPDGSLTGLWDTYLFRVRLTGSSGALLSVVGFWGHQVPPELHGPLAQAVNDWNRDRVWPTVVLDHGGAGVRTEVLTDLSLGATDAQVAEALEIGLVSGVQMLTALTAAMPPVEELED